MTLRCLTLSDLHLEFDGDMGRSFLQTLDPEGIDVVILAGDITMDRFIPETLENVCRRFPDATVLYVHGNHEYYKSERSICWSKTRVTVEQNKNLRWLQNSHVDIKGKRFHGATLWFEDDPLNQRWSSSMNDFYLIKDFENWVYLENEQTQAYLMSAVAPGDVVITHHLPSEKSVASMFKGSALNRFFVSDMEKFIRERSPSLWVHGHTHSSFDYTIPADGNSNAVTRIVCNPRGYFRNDLNPDFKGDKVVEV